MTRGPLTVSARRWGPYAVARCSWWPISSWRPGGSPTPRTGAAYATWALNHSVYSDVIRLELVHFLHGAEVVHPLPYVHARIEYPVLLGFALWLPTWLPGGPASWLAATGLMTAAATFGSIALLRRQHPASAWWIAASPALLFDAAINWDLIGVAFLVAGVVYFGERRYGLSGGATARGHVLQALPGGGGPDGPGRPGGPVVAVPRSPESTRGPGGTRRGPVRVIPGPRQVADPLRRGRGRGDGAPRGPGPVQHPLVHPVQQPAVAEGLGLGAGGPGARPVSLAPPGRSTASRCSW